MKKSVLFVLFALISVAGFSQITGWNAKVGMNFSNYTGDLDLNAKVGFKLGGGFEYAFTDTWSLQPSLFLTSKGAKKDGNSINAMYLELPVMAAARFNVADNTNLVVNAGPYFACGIAGKTKFDLGNDTERKVDTFGDDALKRFDAGLGVGVALEFGRIIAGLDGQFGLVDVEKVGNPKNMTSLLSWDISSDKKTLKIQKAVAEDNSRRLFYFMIEKVISFIGYTIGMYSQFTIGFLLI